MARDFWRSGPLGRGWQLGLVVFLACLLAGPARADAQQYNYRSTLVGERAAGLGGAFTALANDATAVWYNPAGLTQIRDVTASVSISLMEVRSLKGKVILESGETQTSFAIVPTITSTTKPFGRGVVGFSIVVPEQYSFRTDFKHENITLFRVFANSKLTFLREDSSTRNYIGPSYAQPLTDRLSVGLSVYGVYTNSTFRNTSIAKIPTVEGEVTLDLTREESATGIGVTGIAGLLYQYTPNLAVGLAGSPGGPVKVDITRQTKQIVLGLPGGGSAEVPDPTITTFTERLTPNLTAGVAWSQGKWTLAADVLYYWPVEYDLAGEAIKKEGVLNASLGAEYFLKPFLPVRVGLYRDASAAPALSQSDRLQHIQIDNYGLTLALGFLAEHSTFTVGFNLQTGSGQRRADDLEGSDIQAETVLQTTEDIQALKVGLMFGGSFRF